MNVRKNKAAKVGKVMASMFIVAILFGTLISGAGIVVGEEMIFTRATADNVSGKIKMQSVAVYRDAIFSTIRPSYVQRFDAGLEPTWSAHGIDDYNGIVVWDSKGIVVTNADTSEVYWDSPVTTSPVDTEFVASARFTRVTSNTTQWLNISTASGNKKVILSYEQCVVGNATYYINATYTLLAGTNTTVNIGTISNFTTWTYVSIFTDGEDVQVSVEGLGVFTLANAMNINATEVRKIQFGQAGYGEGWWDFIYYASYRPGAPSTIPVPVVPNYNTTDGIRGVSPRAGKEVAENNVQSSYDKMGLSDARLGGGDSFYVEWNVTENPSLPYMTEFTPADLAQFTYQTQEDTDTVYGAGIGGAAVKGEGLVYLTVGYDNMQTEFESKLLDYGKRQMNSENLWIIDYYLDDVQQKITLEPELVDAIKYQYYEALFGEMSKTGTGIVEFEDGTFFHAASLKMLWDGGFFGQWADAVVQQTKKAVATGVTTVTGVTTATVEKATHAAQNVIGTAVSVARSPGAIADATKTFVVETGKTVQDIGAEAVSAGSAMVGAAISAAPKASAVITQTSSNFVSSAKEVASMVAPLAGQSVASLKKVAEGVPSGIATASAAVQDRIARAAEAAGAVKDGLVASGGKLLGGGMSIFSGIKSMIAYVPYVLIIVVVIVVIFFAVKFGMLDGVLRG